MATLLLRLAAPLQSWGSSSKFNIRTTEREPTKSGVIGMIAAALGIQRSDDPEKLRPLAELRFGVRVEKEGRLIKDYHIAKPKKKDSYCTERYYLSDAVFLVALESTDRELLDTISHAVENPVYPLFLGRRSCPPTLPILVGIREGNLVDVLCSEKFHDEKNFSGRIVYDSLNDGTLTKDVPVSFSQLHRQYEFRMKKEEIIGGGEHDAFGELEVES